MTTASYDARRGNLETYFDRTAAAAWAQLTSTAKVSKIRETVRAGRDRMRAALLSWLPADLSGLRLLDAGCGTGALAAEAAARGAEVVAIDIAGNLVEIARERTPHGLSGRIDYRVGDFLSPDLGTFDHVVAMDSLIHYEPGDVERAIANLAERTRSSILFTLAPRTPLLSIMHAVGKAFPRADRAPAIVPIGIGAITGRLEAALGPAGWRAARSERVLSGFYTSHALELVR